MIIWFRAQLKIQIQTFENSPFDAETPDAESIIGADHDFDGSCTRLQPGS